MPSSNSSTHPGVSCNAEPNISRASVPEPNRMYMIRDMNLGLAIRLVDGRITLVLGAGTRGGWHWHCEEHVDGWIGFRNAVSAKYLGWDKSGGFVARAGELSYWKRLVLWLRKPSGYKFFVECAENNRGFKF
ncbi:hypothetical protein F4824DRAFT_498580 [Ustulina deusta]|nr:hypothetical protein F4824DRAFT_498580 [Ustulina deusta]